MARAGSRGSRLPRVIKLIVLLLLALGTAWLSLSTYLPRAFPQRFGGMLGPDAVYNEVGAAYLANRGRLNDDHYRRVADAARVSPLDAEPLLLFGLRALASNDLASAERLIAEARERSPRNETARAAMMAIFLRTNRVREGSDELAALVRVRPRAAERLVPELARLAKDPSSRDAVVRAIGDEPIMASVLHMLAQQNVDPELVLRLGARQPRSTGAFAPWQLLLLEKFVERGDVSRADEVWRSFVGTERTGLVYDPEFSGQPGPPPFNWALTSTGNLGAAERGRGGGLELDYFGRRPGPLARQLLLLRPGRYRIEFPVEGSASGEGSRIVLQVSCRGGGAPLLNMPLEDLSYTPRTLAGNFTVPGGCDSQWLAFVGVPAEFPTAQRARIASLNLQPAER